MKDANDMIPKPMSGYDLKALRGRLGIPQTALAAALGISRRYLQKLEGAVLVDRLAAWAARGLEGEFKRTKAHQEPPPNRDETP